MSKTVALVVGAGAVEKAWNPVLRVLQRYHDFPLTPDGANSFFARLVYLLRWWASSPGELSSQELRKHQELLQEIRSTVATELKEAERSGEIRARAGLESLLRTLLIPYSQQFVLVTTNWDTVVPRSIEDLMKQDYELQLRPLHVHGSTADPNTLYLPSEMTKEPYRSESQEMSIGSMHGSVWRALEQSHRIVLYGLSVDPLDAELGQTLACGFSNPLLEEILIVNPEHETVAHRVNLLVDPRFNVRVLGVNPETFETQEDYTIKREIGRIDVPGSHG